MWIFKYQIKIIDLKMGNHEESHFVEKETYSELKVPLKCWTVKLQGVKIRRPWSYVKVRCLHITCGNNSFKDPVIYLATGTPDVP